MENDGQHQSLIDDEDLEPLSERKLFGKDEKVRAASASIVNKIDRHQIQSNQQAPQPSNQQPSVLDHKAVPTCMIHESQQHQSSKDHEDDDLEPLSDSMIDWDWMTLEGADRESNRLTIIPSAPMESDPLSLGLVRDLSRVLDGTEDWLDSFLLDLDS